MSEVQQKLAVLQQKGWTLAAIALEVGMTAQTVEKWKAGTRSPVNPKLVMSCLDQLMQRKRIPKRRRSRKEHGATQSSPG